jgi:hypothetical protein
VLGEHPRCPRFTDRNAGSEHGADRSTDGLGHGFSNCRGYCFGHPLGGAHCVGHRDRDGYRVGTANWRSLALPDCDVERGSDADRERECRRDAETHSGSHIDTGADAEPVADGRTDADVLGDASVRHADLGRC